ncbi:kinase-like protein [Neoconidiobolus thromboides FSU 785]|nr:kinase-like protein [Neoconidiobolus thromboides FSU 785]
MIPPIHPVDDSTYSLPNLADSFPIDNEVIAYDDKDGHLVIQPDLYITERYKVESLLGQGTFGRVAKCWDKRALRYVAVKVIRAIPKYREAAKIEMRVLSTLKKHDPLNLNKCIHMENDFEFNNHMCMSFDLMGPSLFDFLKSNQFQGFPFPHVQHFARQLLNSISFVHNLGLVHTDLKPENILLLNGSYDEVKRKGSKVKHILKSTEIKLIDFGSATFEDEFHSSIVSTRHYRAPEIILGMGWSYPCDLWSVGCILIELITGDAMFQTHENLEHLAMMARALGPLPKVMYERASKTGKAYFKSSAELNYPNDETTKQSLKNVNGVKTVAKIVNRKGLLGDALTDLITKLLTYEPEDRITAAQALEHPFFSLRLGLDGRIKHKKGLDMSSSN